MRTSDPGHQPSQLKWERLLDYTMIRWQRCRWHHGLDGLMASQPGCPTDSDIDAVVFMEPLDRHITPAESIWRPRDATYHSTFPADTGLEREDIQLDLPPKDIRL